jgi:predicted acyltransferase
MSTDIAAPARQDNIIEPPPVKRGERLISLDVFRGATIIAMILVNNPGTWSAIYPPLRHATWHGWTVTDLIFPFFLFIVGVAVVLAFEKRLAQGAERLDLLKKTGKRAGILFGLGLVMAAYPVFTVAPEFGLRPELSTLRIMGVLQRIAICYFLATLIFLYARPKWHFIWMAIFLFGYWAAMMLVPVPGLGAGNIDSATDNLAAYIDRVILGNHLWVGAGRQWDPEGLLSTIPAIVSTLIGVWAGRIILSDRQPLDRAVQLFAWGAVLLSAGYVWDWFFPINKPIWTSSYAVFTGGQAMIALALCYWVIDIRGKKSWTQPFLVYGMNAITVFFLSGIVARSLNIIQIPTTDGSISLQRVIFETFFLSWASEINASLAYAITWIVLWYLILWWMYSKKLFIKV